MQGFLVDPPVIPGENSPPDLPPDKIIQIIPGNRGDNQQNDQQFKMHRTCRTKRTGNEQKRVPRKKGSHNQTSLTENDSEQNDIYPRSILGNNRTQSLIDMQNHAEQLHEIHNRIKIKEKDRLKYRRKSREKREIYHQLQSFLTCGLENHRYIIISQTGMP